MKTKSGRKVKLISNQAMSRKQAKLSPPVRRAVNTLIASKKETKMVSTGSFYNSPYGNSSSTGIPFNAGITTTSEFYPLIPNCPQGVGEGERVGDSIMPTGLIVKVMVAANGAYTSSQLTRCRLFIVSSRNIKDQQSQINLDPASLLDYGGFVAAFDGNPSPYQVPVNKEGWVVHADKKFTITKGTGTTPSLSNGYTGDQVCVPSNQVLEFTFRVKLPKKLHYLADNLDSPSNAAIWFALGYTQPDGNSTADVTNTRIVANWISTMYYKDA